MVWFSELYCVEVLVYDYTVNGLDVELNVLLCLECDLYKFAVTAECALVALVDECGVNCSLAVAVQTVLAVVCHAACTHSLDANILILVCIVGECKAECVHICKTLAADCDYNLLACLVALLVGCDGDFAGYNILGFLINTVADACSCNRDVVSVDEVVLVDISW